MISLDCQLPLKLRSVRIRPDTGQASGYLWHFGHFMHDLVMPLTDWLVDSNVQPHHICLYIKDSPDQSVGPFRDMIKPLLGIQASLVSVEEFQNLQVDELVLHGYMFGPYEPSSLANIQRWILPRFDLRRKADQPDILLIERALGTHGFEQREDVPEDIKQTGVQRRHIKNHAEIAALLSERYKGRFRNVILEDMPLADQVGLFHHAKLVIGQHGAGLNNLIWMNDPHGMVIELTPCDIKTFENLCAAKGIHYQTAGPRGKMKVEIDWAEVSNLLDEWDAAPTHRVS